MEKIQNSKTKFKPENVKLVTADLQGYTEGFKKVMCQSMHFGPALDVNQF